MERKTIEKCSFFPCFSIYFRSFLLFIWEKRFFFFSGNNLFLGEFFRIVSCLLGKHIFRRFFSRELFFFRRSFFFVRRFSVFQENFTILQDYRIFLFIGKKTTAKDFFFSRRIFQECFWLKISGDFSFFSIYFFVFQEIFLCFTNL